MGKNYKHKYERRQCEHIYKRTFRGKQKRERCKSFGRIDADGSYRCKMHRINGYVKFCQISKLKRQTAQITSLRARLERLVTTLPPALALGV